MNISGCQHVLSSISQDDSDRVLGKLDTYLKAGVSPKDASIMAVKDVVAEHARERADTMATIESHIAKRTDAVKEMSAKANEAATSPENSLPHPTAAQSDAGNYKKGRIKLHGLDISIENPAGSVRVAKDGSWASAMPNHYGYIRRTEGNDGDHVDTFVGPKPESKKVFVVDQVDPKTGKFDEHKVMLGFETQEAAEAGYKAAYPADWKGMGAVTETGPERLKTWLRAGKATEPFGAAQKAQALESRYSLNVDESASADATHDPDVDSDIARVTGKPSLEVTDLRGGKQLDAQQRGFIAAALKDLLSLGLPRAALEKISAIHAQDGQTGDGTYYWQPRAIGIHTRIFDAIAAGDRAAMKTLRGLLAHELIHSMDDGAQHYYSSVAPSLEIVGAGRQRVPVGGIAAEAHEAWLKNGPVSKFLDYPFAMLHDVAPQGMTNADWNGVLQAEVLAQLGRLYLTNPKLLQRTMPKSFFMFEGIFSDIRNNHDRPGVAVQRALQGLGSDGLPARRAAGRNREADRGSIGDRNAREGVEGSAGGLDRSASERQDGNAGRRQRNAGLEAASRPAVGEAQALTGAPDTYAPSAVAQQAARDYMSKAGLPYSPPTDYVKVDPERAKRIAEAYEEMQHAPKDGRVRMAYSALIKETQAQWAAIKATGLKVTFATDGKPYPYTVPGEVFKDVAENNHMWVFPTVEGFGSDESVDVSDNPLLAPTGETIDGHKLVANDVFRIVHDYFGHIKNGVGFRANGEENAWRAHAAMYSPMARAAMTSETRGQNSWVNYGPHGEANRTANQIDTVYADQKTGLLPREFTEDNYAKPDALEAREPGEDIKSATVGAERGERDTGRKSISGADKLKIARDGLALGLTPAEIRVLQNIARTDMSRFPPKDGWAPIEIVGVERKPKTLANGDVVYENAVKYKAQPYKFNAPPGMDRAPQKIDGAWAKKVSDAGTKAIVDLYERAKKGDAVAQNIVAHASWYRAMAVRLREEFGAAGDLFADLLGATSPNTPVETNWRFAVDVIKRFSRGELKTEMQAFEKWIAEGKAPSAFPAEEKIRQVSGKLYGMNSGNSMIALLNLWRNVDPGMAPKARNFALNLIGQSNMATIDVWAARFLRRMSDSIRGASYPRIPTVAEKGVTGKWNAKATGVSGEFGFGAEVMQQMSDALAKKGIDLTPPDLQAVAWFVEKALWTEKGWTSKQGEGGSFETESDKSALQRFLAGWSIQVGKDEPTDHEVELEAARLLATVRSDDNVVVSRATPTIGMYDDKSGERSFDTELTVKPGWSPWSFVGELTRIAKERKQDSFFFSRVLKPGEENANARPGVEVYFKSELDMARVLPKIQALVAAGQQGFTLTVDPRSEKLGGAEADRFNGVRLQYVPEFEIRSGGPNAAALASGNKDKVNSILEKKRADLLAMVDSLTGNEGIALARLYSYDTLVVTKEDYDAYTQADSGDRAESSREALRPGQSIDQVLADAARRYESGRREDDSGDLPFGPTDGDEGRVASKPDSLDAREPEPLWYSALNTAITEKAPWSKDGSIPVNQLRGWLGSKSKDGTFKQDELKWSGLEEFLATQTGRVSRADVDAYLSVNGVNVTEALLGEEQQDIQGAYARLVDAGYTIEHQEYFGPTVFRDGQRVEVDDLSADLQQDLRLVEASADGDRPLENGLAKHADYQLPGGTKYRNLLLTLPVGDAAVRVRELELRRTQGGSMSVAEREEYHSLKDSGAGRNAFHSSHFDQPNILAHVRFNERTDVDGKRVLFIEEIQSDWAQRGRKEGFHAEPTPRWNPQDGFVEGVPSAPFVGKTEAWVALALKRMIRYAADNGFDRVAWTTGEQQANRYDLSKHVKSILYAKKDNGTYTIKAAKTRGGRSEVIAGSVGAAKLSDYVGKAVADKIVNNLGTAVPFTAYRQLTGLDLKVGGKGMTDFYDKIVPNVANDLLKKLGGGRVVEVALGGHGYGVQRVMGKGWQVVDARNLPVNEQTFRDQQDALRWIVDNDPTRRQPGFDITTEMAPRARKPQALFAIEGADATTAASKPEALDFDLRAAATNAVHDSIATSRSFNLWDRTVGTPMHKASKHAGFKRVYDGVQNFLNDSSQLMMEAADLAPDLLPKLDGLNDLFKKGLSKDDLKKVSAAVFDGTLNDVVYSDAELVARGMNADQIGYYRQARSAIDKSLTDASTSEAVKQAAGLLPQATLDQAKANGDPWVIVDALANIAQKTAVQQQVYDQLRKRAAEIEDLKRQGYAPLQRFGQYTVHLVNPDGSSALFTMHETQREANAFARAARAGIQPGQVLTQGVMSQEAWRLFQGVSPDTMEIFAQSIDASHAEVMQKYIKLAVNNRSVMKRMLERKEIAGFQTDVQRTLAQFITSNARAAAKNYHWGEVLKATNEIPKEQGDVKDEAVRLKEYLEHPKEEAGALRGLLFIQFLGGSIASAVTNATQPIMMTFPWLSQYGGSANAAAQLVAAGKVAAGGVAEPSLAAAMARATKEGIVSPHEVAGLYAESIRNFGSNMMVRRALKVWGSLFSRAEQFNRRITFVAAYRTAVKEGMPDPYGFAVNAIAETQGVYNKGNRPNFSRGAVGATLMTFKQYSIAYLEFLSRLPKKQKAIALAALVLAAGLQGLPGADDLEDVIDTIAESLGYSFNSKKQLREWATRTLGESAGAFLVSGASAIPGVPLDVQGRLGIGNLIPGTGILKRSNEDKSREVLDFFGPAGAQAKSFLDAFSAAQEGDAKAVAVSALPVAVRNALQGLGMAQSGFYKDTKGRRVVDTDGYDAAIKAIGFQPGVVARQTRIVQDLQQDIGLAKNVETTLADRMARAILDHDPAELQKARVELLQWNQTNPGARIAITPAQVQQRVRQAMMSREQRFLKSAPKEMRGGVMTELRGQ